MEKIFELEDLDENENSDTTSSSVSSDQSNRTVPNTISSNSRDNTAIRRDNATEPRPDTSSSQASMHSENQMASPSAAGNVDLVVGLESLSTNTSGNTSGSLQSRMSSMIFYVKLMINDAELNNFFYLVHNFNI